jgi:hypothetical protein
MFSLHLDLLIIPTYILLYSAAFRQAVLWVFKKFYPIIKKLSHLHRVPKRTPWEKEEKNEQGNPTRFLIKL